jgi:RNA polymerase sigma-70 factor (ECF subfamily)
MYVTTLTMSPPTTADASRELSSEEGLVTAARDGDSRAFAALVRAHQRRVFHLAGRFYRRREDVEEVAQDTFLQAWNKLASFRGDAPFEAWITRICLNLCYQRMRRRHGREESLDDFDLAAPGDLGRRVEARVETARLLARLDPRDRFLLQLLHGEEWSVEEAARRLGWSKANVKVRAHRARKRLRRILEEEDSR